jgi:hypothetical protein
MRMKPPTAAQTFVAAAIALLLGVGAARQGARPAPARNSGGGGVAARAAQADEGFSIGVNLDQNHDYSTDGCWVNVFHRFAGSGSDKTNVGWGRLDKPWEPNPSLQLTPDGYPLSDAACFTYGRGYPAGIYKFHMEGSGTPAFSGKGRFASPSRRNGDVTEAEVEVRDVATMLTFRLTDIDPANPPRNLKLIVPGLPVDTDRVYADWFLEKLKPFSTLREMDPGRTNHSDLKEWADRVRPEQFCQTTSKGIAHEFMIARANESGKDLWVCVPDQATDEYMAVMAKLFRAKLNPKSKLYVEYSNEWWNNSFRQHARGKLAAEQNAALTSSDPSARIRQHLAWKVHQVATVFNQAFADRPGQVRPVLAVQGADPWWAEVGLKYWQEKWGPPGNTLYALAPTGYYSFWEGDKDRPGGVDVEGMTLDDYFAELNRVVAEPRVKLQKHRAFAEQYGLKLIAYEGGLGVTDRNGMMKKNINGDIKAKATDDPRMGELTTKMFDAWRRDAGDGLFMWFNFCSPGGKFGRWGLLEDIQQKGSQKYDAAVAYARKHAKYAPDAAAAAAAAPRPRGTERDAEAPPQSGAIPAGAKSQRARPPGYPLRKG